VDHDQAVAAQGSLRAVRRALVLFVAAIVLVAPARAGAVGDCTPAAGWPAPRPDLAGAVVVLVNQHRAALGLPVLAVSPTLSAAATWKARHLAAYGYFAHDDPAPPVARTAGERIAACGYPSPFAGENIAFGQPSPAAVMAAWLASPGHRANLERPEFRALGVGVAPRGAALEWVQDFGDVADAGSLAAPVATPPSAPAPPPPAGVPVPVRALPAPVVPRARSVRLRARCRVRGRRTVRCRVRVSRTARVRAALRRRGHTWAMTRGRRIGPGHAATLRLRAHRPLAPGRYAVVWHAGGTAGRRIVHVR
jgi:uncharacterized protein YkwD